MRFKFPPLSEPAIGPAVRTVETWDRSQRLWIVTAHDANENQVGLAAYAPRKEGLPLAREHALANARDALAREA